MHTVVPAKSLVIGIIAVVISILLLSNVSGNDLEDRNDPPLTPCIPDGPTTGYSDIEYEYSSAAIDPDGDDLYYMWDWGDNSTPVWYGPYYSGQTSNISHEWTELGTYQVRVKAKDNNNVESDWSESLNVSIIGQTLYVGGSGPGNYSNIQDAIDDATSGDTVYVYNGTYYEHVIVDKSINLIGENRNSTTINAGWNGDPVRINADWVNISEFKIKNSGDIGYEAGVYTTSNNNNISHNIILRCSNGIFLKWDFYNNTVFENTIINNGEGIYLCGQNSRISKNVISSNGNYGIRLKSENNTISNNEISNNDLGIDFGGAYNNNIISNNTFDENNGGMFIYGANNHILNNNFTNCGMIIIGELNNVSNNIVNNKPVIYLENKSDLIIDSNAGQIIIINCENITINNQTLSNTTAGIELFKSNNCTIFNNSISNNTYFASWGIILLWSNDTKVFNNSIKNTYEAIYLEGTHGNIIRENTISKCIGVGIYLNWNDNNTIIEDNIISSCDEAIQFYASSGNVIRYNNITNNVKGIRIRYSSNNNTFYHNNLINSSSYQARDEGNNNEWFNEMTSLGNHWDDYTGIDGNHDGVGDIPYNISGGANSKDFYPLVTPYGPPHAEFIYGIIDKTVNLNSSRTYDYDGFIVNWSWDFGDENVSYEQNPISYTYNKYGRYTITLEVTDNDGRNDVFSEVILLGGDWIISLSKSWNFASIFYNESIPKEEIFIRFNDSYLNWSEATTDNILNPYIFGWDRTTQSYTFADYFDSGYGYWIYSTDICELWMIKRNSNTDDYITELEQNWNIIGLPMIANISKSSLIITTYSGTNYNWTEAVSLGIVSDFIFGWDGNSQSYVFSDMLEVGRSYWLYAYEDCILKREV